MSNDNTDRSSSSANAMQVEARTNAMINDADYLNTSGEPPINICNDGGKDRVQRLPHFLPRGRALGEHCNDLYYSSSRSNLSSNSPGAPVHDQCIYAVLHRTRLHDM